MKQSTTEIQESLANRFFELFYTKNMHFDESGIHALSIAEAYQIQDRITEKKIARGEKVVGYKVGCTSKAIQQQFGLSEPIYGRLFEPYIHRNGAELRLEHYVNCAIEPEIVITTGTDLVGENLADDVLIAAIADVRAGIELHNYKFWFSPTSSQELIMSNGIWAGLVVGDEITDPKDLTFTQEVFRVLKNRELVVAEPASEIMNGLGPLESLRWLVGCLTRKGEHLPAGSIVIPGSPVKLVRIEDAGILDVVIDKVGSVQASFRLG